MRAVRDSGSGVEAPRESGFTLIELMVVLLIMGILLAIAIPTFLGVSGSAKDKAAQQERALELLEKHGLKGLEWQGPQAVDMRQGAKEALLQAWHGARKENPEKQSLMLAFSNRDVNDLNRLARILLKGSGHIAKEDFTYTIKKEIEDDFGRKQTISEEKSFSQGDRIFLPVTTMTWALRTVPWKRLQI